MTAKEFFKELGSVLLNIITLGFKEYFKNKFKTKKDKKDLKETKK